jgi:hypothetical protein
MDAVALAEPLGQKYPAVQLLLHAVVRGVLLLHVPAAHLVHVGAPARLNWPAGQRDAVALMDPAGQAYPGEQLLLQALARAVLLLQVPTAQSVHA